MTTSTLTKGDASLPKPIALTPEEARQVAAGTAVALLAAGSLSPTLMAIIRQGGYPIDPGVLTGGGGGVFF